MNTIEIKIDNQRENQRLPLLPLVLYEHLEEKFETDYLLTIQHKNNDEAIGYIRGVRDMLKQLKLLTKYDNEEVD